jgi:hypothetical protein
MIGEHMPPFVENMLNAEDKETALDIAMRAAFNSRNNESDCNKVVDGFIAVLNSGTLNWHAIAGVGWALHLLGPKAMRASSSIDTLYKFLNSDEFERSNYYVSVLKPGDELSRATYKRYIDAQIALQAAYKKVTGKKLAGSGCIGVTLLFASIAACVVLDSFLASSLVSNGF